VPIVAGVAERQATIQRRPRMVELVPELAARVQIFQGDRLSMPRHDATLFPLPADADALLGAGEVNGCHLRQSRRSPRYNATGAADATAAAATPRTRRLVG
jgi:hypothetical protein